MAQPWGFGSATGVWGRLTAMLALGQLHQRCQEAPLPGVYRYYPATYNNDTVTVDITISRA